jgi:hypothetical protein
MDSWLIPLVIGVLAAGSVFVAASGFRTALVATSEIRQKLTEIPASAQLSEGATTKPIVASSRMRVSMGTLILVALAVAGWYYGPGFISSFMWGYEGHAGLPSCASSYGQTDAERAFENSPFAKTSGIEIVAMSDVITISAGPEKVACKATIILNSSRQGIMDYSFSKATSLGAGQYFVQASLDLETFHPYSR